MLAPCRTCTLTLSHLAIFEQVEPGLNFIVISVSMKVITLCISSCIVLKIYASGDKLVTPSVSIQHFAPLIKCSQVLYILFVGNVTFLRV